MDSEAHWTRRRLVALWVGPWYLLAVTGGFVEVTSAPPVATLAVVVAAAGLILWVLVVFGVKAHRYQGQSWRFGLSSVLLVLVPLCVYLAALRFLLRSLPFQNWAPATWCVFALASLALMLVSTVVLLCFAEAAVWMARLVMRR